MKCLVLSAVDEHARSTTWQIRPYRTTASASAVMSSDSGIAISECRGRSTGRYCSNGAHGGLQSALPTCKQSLALGTYAQCGEERLKKPTMIEAEGERALGGPASAPIE